MWLEQISESQKGLHIIPAAIEEPLRTLKPFNFLASLKPKQCKARADPPGKGSKTLWKLCCAEIYCVFLRLPDFFFFKKKWKFYVILGCWKKKSNRAYWISDRTLASGFRRVRSAKKLWLIRGRGRREIMYFGNLKIIN